MNEEQMERAEQIRDELGEDGISQEHSRECRCTKCDWERARYETEFEDNQD